VTEAATTKKVFVKTYGCQMNVYDSQRIVETLAADGYAETATADDADLVVLNTCHIREKASEKVFSDIGRYAKAGANRPGASAPVIAVAGCVAQAEGAEIARRASSVGVIVGPQSYHRLPELVAEKARKPKAVVALDMPVADKFAKLPTRTRPRSPTAFLTVQEGCDKFCTFCVVPYTRGAEYSRPASQLIEEAKVLAGQGVRELTLLGQNVNAYRGAGPNGAALGLAGLLWQLARIDGLERLRYTTSHPNDMGDDLIHAHGEMPKLMPYLHLPFQSGSDRVLAAMNRNHTREVYLDLIAKLRAARPDLALSTDVIVGFPGETDDDFEDTLSLVEEVRFASSFSFKYSPRPGTPAASKADQVAEPVKAERLERLQTLLKQQQLAFNEQKAGRVIPVLWESRGKKDGVVIGKSPYLQTVEAWADASLIGSITETRIERGGPNGLYGVAVGRAAGTETQPPMHGVA
jgi:tRNA-2-methylthio-N6-dimethylallyladenosine synthase